MARHTTILAADDVSVHLNKETPISRTHTACAFCEEVNFLGTFQAVTAIIAHSLMMMLVYHRGQTPLDKRHRAYGTGQ